MSTTPTKPNPVPIVCRNAGIGASGSSAKPGTYHEKDMLKQMSKVSDLWLSYVTNCYIYFNPSAAQHFYTVQPIRSHDWAGCCSVAQHP